MFSSKLASLIVALVVAAALTPGAVSVAISLRDPDAKVSNGDTSEWIKELRALAGLLPHDPEWYESIVGFIQTHRGAAIDLCNVKQFGCSAHHEVETLNFEGALGVFAWDQLPTAITSITFDKSFFFDSFALPPVPGHVETLRYFDCRFDVSPPPGDHDHAIAGAKDMKPKAGAKTLAPGTSLRELVCRNCALTTLDWATVPPHVVYLDVSCNNFTAIDFEKLPKNLRVLNVSFSAAKPGNIDPWGRLPPTLTTVDLSGLALTTIGEMPPTLETLVLARNKLAAGSELSKVSTSVKTLKLNYNLFSGECPPLTLLTGLLEVDLSGNALTSLQFSHLPRTISIVRASNNQIDGRLDLASLPRELTILELAGNKLTGNADLGALPKFIDTLDLQRNELSGPVDLTNLPNSMRFLFINDNKFVGRPDLSRLPVDLRRIMFGNNEWTSLMPPK